MRTRRPDTDTVRTPRGPISMRSAATSINVSA
jgi:hypothetical protein